MPHIAEMDQDKPCSYQIRNVMQEIRIHHTVKYRVAAEYDEEDGRDALAVAVLARNHLTACDCFDEEDEWRDGQDVVV